jgi:hypothetical protein
VPIGGADFFSAVLRFPVVSGGVLCVVGCVATALALPRFLRYDARIPNPLA